MDGKISCLLPYFKICFIFDFSGEDTSRNFENNPLASNDELESPYSQQMELYAVSRSLIPTMRATMIQVFLNMIVINRPFAFHLTA